ncbi:MAG: efflux RND transporter periplasmic adaptor subunit [Endomicrobiia bacterium]|nr:efflux RND transporter periplasmic adaptor subunit [Endomicrobiia bacterium]
MTKKKKIIVIILAVCAAIILAATFFISKSKTARAARQTSMIKVRRGDISIRIRLTGSVQPRNRLEIKPQVAGRIESILLVEGDRVYKGQTLAWMSSSDRAALLDVARAKGDDEVKKWEDTYMPAPVISPLDGFIIARNKEPGQAVSLSDIILVMADKLIVRADVDETDLAHMQKGKRVNVTLDAYPDDPFRGVIEHIAYESRLVNNVTVYEVRINPVSPPKNFRAGMTANIELVAASSRDTLLAPLDAVIERRGRKSVRRVSASGNKAADVAVETGITDGRNIEIISGLNEGDTILAGGVPAFGSSGRSSNSSRSNSGSPSGAMRFVGR